MDARKISTSITSASESIISNNCVARIEASNQTKTAISFEPEIVLSFAQKLDEVDSNIIEKADIIQEAPLIANIQGNEDSEDFIEEDIEVYSDSFEDNEDEFSERDKFALESKSNLEIKDSTKSLTAIDSCLEKSSTPISQVEPIPENIKEIQDNISISKKSFKNERMKAIPDRLELSKISQIGSHTVTEKDQPDIISQKVASINNETQCLKEKDILQVIGEARDIVFENLKIFLNSQESYESAPSLVLNIIEKGNDVTAFKDNELLEDMVLMISDCVQESVRKMFKNHQRYKHPYRPVFLMKMLPPRPIKASTILQGVSMDLDKILSPSYKTRDSEELLKENIIAEMKNLYDIEASRVEVLLEVANDLWQELENEVIEECRPVFSLS